MLNDKKNTDKLLDLYFSGKLKGDSCDIVCGWLLSDDDVRQKEESLERQFDRYWGRSGRPAREYVRISLSRLHRELGFRTTRRHHFSGRGEIRKGIFGFIVGSGTVAAAAVLLSVFVLPDMFGTGDEPAVATMIVTGASHGGEVTLPDGSAVNLKAGTSIGYDKEGFAQNRTVEIDGEAFFTVTHDSVHPFAVRAGDDLEVRVLGTEFNVRASHSTDSAEVVLQSGSVEVRSAGETLTLTPMQRAKVDRRDQTITLDEIGPGELLRLRGLNLSFEGVSLEEALRHTGDFFGVTMRIAAGLPATEGLVLSLEDDATLTDALFMLQAVSGIFDYMIEEGVVTITKKQGDL